MNDTRKFTPRNDGFTCQKCDKIVPKAPKTFRNHCPHCLWSLHVDVFPGDRASKCVKLMKPSKIETKNGEFTRIIHVCTACKHQQPNKVAEDDEKESLWAIYEGKRLEN